MKFKAILISFLIWGTLFAVADAAQTGELCGTRWYVMAINDGREVVQRIITGTTITMHFETDKNLTGSAGCNSYKTTYTADGEKIKIRSAATTRMTCSRPPGIMAQETLFLNTLENVTQYHKTGDQLSLLKEDGSTAIILLRDAVEINTFKFVAGTTMVRVQTLPGGKMILGYQGVEYGLEQIKNDFGIMCWHVSDDFGTFFLTQGDFAVARIKGNDLPVLTLVDSADGKRLSPQNDEFFKSSVIEAVIEPVYDNSLFLKANDEAFWMERTSTDRRRYQVPSDPQTTFWRDGDKATLTLRGKVYPGQILKRQSDENRVKGLAEIDGRPLLGAWRVMSIAGKDALPGTTITMTFAENGRLSGRATINNYFALWLALDDAIIVSGGGSTMMAGSDEHLQQERIFLRTLGEVNRYEVRGNKLIMRTADGAQIIASKTK